MLGTCIGINNYRHFLRYLVATSFACLTNLLLCALSLGVSQGRTDETIYMDLGLGFLSIVFLVPLVSLLYYHWVLIAEGVTTREYAKGLPPLGDTGSKMGNLRAACLGIDVVAEGIGVSQELMEQPQGVFGIAGIEMEDDPPEGWDDRASSDDGQLPTNAKTRERGARTETSFLMSPGRDATLSTSSARDSPRQSWRPEQLDPT